jgi:hypothetical protein
MIFQGTTSYPTLDAAPMGDKTPFFTARVMNPTEVRAATESHPSPVGSWTSGRWYLCGDVQSELFAMFKTDFRDATSVRLTAFTTPAGATYAVVSHQVHGWAHRFVLPLHEPSVQAMLLGLQKAELGFLFGNEGAEDAVLLYSPLDGSAFAPLLARANSVPKEKFHDVMTELPRVIGAMKMPSQVPSLRSGVRVTDVSVSVVLPARAVMQFYGEKSNGVA